MMFIEMLFGAMIALIIMYVWACYKIWDLSENDSEIGGLTLKEFARMLYCMHWSIRLFETGTTEKES